MPTPCGCARTSSGTRASRSSFPTTRLSACEWRHDCRVSEQIMKSRAATTFSWSPIPKGWSSVNYARQCPQRLYRYRKLTAGNLEDRIMFEVIEEKIFLAGAGRLNDPDEGCISWEFNGSDQ